LYGLTLINCLGCIWDNFQRYTRATSTAASNKQYAKETEQEHSQRLPLR
jgi:hypothetical protein